jgi:molybdopterin-containing oxidoreductase family membrane subunit
MPDVNSNKTLWPGYWIVLLVLAIVGVIYIVRGLVNGMSETALTNTVPWGLNIALYIFFVGLSAGAFLLSTLVYVFRIERYEPAGRLALWIALITLMAGGAAILLDVGHPERAMWRLFVNWNFSSPLALVAHVYVLYMLIILAELWVVMRADIALLADANGGWRARIYRILGLGTSLPTPGSDRRDARILLILGAIGVPVAPIVHAGVGSIFAVLKAQPLWFSGLYPVMFLVSALASGGALLTLAYALLGPRDERYRPLVIDLAKLTGFLLALDLVLYGSEYLVGIYGDIPSHIAVYTVIATGSYWWVFWFVQLLAGGIVPLILIFNNVSGRSVFWLSAASALIVVGILAVRLNIVIPGLTVPQLENLASAYVEPRMSTDYFPNAAEWLSNIGVVSLLLIVFSLGYLGLPLVRGRPAQGAH